MSEVIDLGARRPRVVYTVTLSQGYDGSLGLTIHDVACDEPRNRLAVAAAMRQGAAMIEDEINPKKPPRRPNGKKDREARRLAKEGRDGGM